MTRKQWIIAYAIGAMLGLVGLWIALSLVDRAVAPAAAGHLGR